MVQSRKKVIRHAFGSCWPTPAQTALLQAACHEGPAAIAAWPEWQDLAADIPVEKLDAGSRRLLPLLYRNLASAGVAGEALASLKIEYRLAWAQNRLLLSKFRPLLTAFQAEGINLMVLKGAALAPLYYRDEGVRPMSDVDFLFRPEEAARAFAVLQKLAWRPVHRNMAEILPLTHSYTFKNTGGEEIDPHWHALHECCRPGDDDAFWAASVPLVLEGFPVRAMGPADQLLHLCSHGLRWNRTPPLRWIADAATVIRVAGPALDWDRLVREAARRQLVQALRTALAYLHETFPVPVPVPAEVLAALDRQPVTRLERMEFHWKTTPPGFLGPLPVETCLYWRIRAEDSLFSKLKGLPVYLRIFHNFPTYRKLFRYIFFLGWKHAWRHYA